MKNKYLFLIFIFFLFSYKNAQSELNIEALNITVDKEKNEVRFQNNVLAKDDLGNTFYSESATYNKNKKTFIWFGGLNSDMDGTKAIFLSNLSKKNKINFCRFDYFGHGKSSKRFEDCVISDCLTVALK